MRSMSEVNGFRKQIHVYFGTRWDCVQSLSRGVQLFHRTCERCKQKTYVDIDWPEEKTVVCNLCAAAMSEQAGNASDMTVVHELQDDVLVNLYEQAQAEHVPVQNLILDHLGARYRKPLQKILLLNRTAGVIYTIERKPTQ
jgi:hypothetical protein